MDFARQKHFLSQNIKAKFIFLTPLEREKKAGEARL